MTIVHSDIFDAWLRALPAADLADLLIERGTPVEHPPTGGGGFCRNCESGAASVQRRFAVAGVEGTWAICESCAEDLDREWLLVLTEAGRRLRAGGRATG